MKVYLKTIPEIKLRSKNGQVLKVQIKSSKDSYQYFKQIFDNEILEVYEEFMVVYLNSANNTVGWIKISQGGITGTLVDIRLIFKGALECLATSMILCHNHPSGRLFPSEADKILTKKIVEAGSIMDIKVIDHLIISSESYYSFADEGQI